MDLATFRRLDNPVQHSSMNSPCLIRARFHLVQFVDCCIHWGTLTKEGLYSAYRAVFKDSMKRPKIFAFSNLILCSVTLIYFIFSLRHLGIKKPTTKYFRYVFLINVFLEWMIAFGLIYAYTKGGNIKCQLWCLCETVCILIHLLLILPELVVIAWPGLVLVSVMCIIKLFGLWVIYYHSLELKSTFISTRNRRRPDQDGMKISYFASTPPSKILGKNITRRGTDQTSIASSGPPSPSSPTIHPYDDDQPQDGFQRRSTSTSLSPPPPHHFQFLLDDNFNTKFGGEPQYSEIMVDPGIENIIQHEGFHQPGPDLEQGNMPDTEGQITQFSKENIINSGLMCGGSSSINMDLV